MARQPLQTRTGILRGLRALAPLGLALAALVLAAAPAFAQSGQVRGQVVDRDGNAFPFVDVFLENERATCCAPVLTDENGRFVFSPVDVGEYKMYAFASGFASDKFEGIYVEVGSTRSYTVRLLPMEMEEEVVDVRADILDLVDTRRTEVSSTLRGDFVSKIPLQNKRIQDIVALFPGVIRQGSSDSSDISIGGGTGAQIGYRLNGASINDPVDGGAMLDIPTAAIESFKLITTGFSARYGEQSTGMAEIVTKRGSNELEFSYGLNFRHTDFGASEIDGLEDAQILIDELLRAEGTLLQQEVAAGFDLLGIPLSTRDDDQNPPARRRIRHTLAAGGPIVRDRMFFHSTFEVLADDFGSPYAGGTNQTDQLLYTGKVNWDITENNKLELSVNFDISDTTGFASAFQAESTNTRDKDGKWTLSVEDTHIFSDNIFLESRLTVLQQYETSRPVDLREGVGVLYQVPLPPGGPTTFNFGGSGFNFDETTRSIRLEETLNINLAQGRHQLETGFSFQDISFHSFVERGPTVIDFRVVDDTNIFGDPALAGRVIDFGPAIRTDDQTWAASIFVHDKWQVTPNLTVDIGLRGDYQEFVGELFLAPRIGFSLDPIGDGKTRFFGNWGIYYDNLFANALQWTQRPDQFFQEIVFAGAFQERDFRQTSIEDIYKEALATGIRPPTASDAVAYLARGEGVSFHDRFVLGADLTAPTNSQWSVGLERRLPANMRLQVSYTENDRTHQSRLDVITRRRITQTGEFEIRDRIFASTGVGRFRQWSAEIQKPFSDSFELNLSYVWSKNTGPVPPPDNPIDPADVISENGLLSGDRTHVVKLQGRGALPWKIDLSGDFTWQSGAPITASILTRSGRALRPFGRNTLRLPSARQLNFGLRRPFQTADGKLNITAELRVFNVLNEFNVFGGLGRFEVPEGTSNPQSFPPLRPTVLPTGIDVGRSLELGLTISF